jgi:hypothetical protein
MTKLTTKLFATVFFLTLLSAISLAQDNREDYPDYRTEVQHRAIRLTFDKSLASFGVWHGKVGGDIHGNLKTVMQSYVISGDIARVEFDFYIDGGPGEQFTIRLIGLLNPRTGKVYMDGFVSEGEHAGQRVEEEGSLIDLATFRFKGTILLKRSGR